MADNNITASNSVAVLIVEGLFPQGIRLEQFATDQSVAQDDVTIAEARMGVDGVLAIGYVPSPRVVKVSLEASSPTQEAFAQIFQQMDAQRTIFDMTLTVRVPSLSKSYTWSNGGMTAGQPFPAHKKLLDPTQWSFTFGKFSSQEI